VIPMASKLRIGLMTVLAALPVALVAQQLGGLGSAPAKPKGHVVFVAEQQSVKAGKPGVLELHFKVDDGFHVNSHTPKSELLIPTAVTVQAATGVKASDAVYPAGTSYSFSFEPNEKLDVYTGEFVVKVPVTATPGEHTLDGSLHYQACDHAACYPPKTLPLQVLFTAK
jgi:hypothetical protein